MNSLDAPLEQDEGTDTAGWFGLGFFLPWAELGLAGILEISV